MGRDSTALLVAEPEPLEISSKSAICVIDMQNYDVSQGGSFETLGIDITHGQRVVEPIQNLVVQARRLGVPVIFTRNIIRKDPLLRPDPGSPWYWKGDFRAYDSRPDLERGMYIEGNWGAEIIDALPREAGDIVLDKTAYSAFVGTDLDAVLRRRGVRYLFLVGIGTPTCVDATARDAYFHEYFPIVLEDCCNAILPETHAQALFHLKRRYAWVATSTDALSALAEVRGMPLIGER